MVENTMTGGTEDLDAAAAGEPGEGGDAACWAHLVCPECGAVESEGHVAGCSVAPAAG